MRTYIVFFVGGKTIKVVAEQHTVGTSAVAFTAKEKQVAVFLSTQIVGFVIDENYQA
jgi:hypothetical protein